MRCQEAREQLAIYRELSKAEHDRLQQHLSGCLTCAATQAAYQAQNNLLSALPAISPSAGLAAAVRGRTVGQHRSVRRFSWGWAAAALSLLLLFLGVVGGAVSIAADALPGDALYAVKRVTEQVRLVLTLDPAARDRYQHQLAETRREEVREIVRLERQARVQFQGYLEAVADDVWVVDGLTVRVDSAAWAGAPPQGSVFFIEAQAAAGETRSSSGADATTSATSNCHACSQSSLITITYAVAHPRWQPNPDAAPAGHSADGHAAQP